MGKITINFSEDFETIDLALEHVLKMKTVLSLSFDVLKSIAAAGASSAALPPAAPAMTAASPVHDAPAPRAPIQERSATAAPSSVQDRSVSPAVARVAEPLNAPAGLSAPRNADAPVRSTPGGEAVGEGAIASAETPSGEPIKPTAPAETAPKGKRGRPKREAPAATEAAPGPAAVNAAINAGIAEANDPESFLANVRRHLSAHGSTHYMSVLSSCTREDGSHCTTASQVPEGKRAKFLEKLAELVAKTA